MDKREQPEGGSKKMADDIKNVFISHVHEDDDGLARVKDLASKAGLNLRDSSINSTNPNNANHPDYIKSDILAPQIRWASTLLVYVTPKTKESEWVNWEIEYAEKQGKRVVGVYAHGAGECDVPEALEKYADAMCGWNAEGLVDAIMGENDEWHGPAGELRDPRPINRHGC